MSDLGFVLGEYRRTLDERHRVSIPRELTRTLAADETDFILVKERPGSLSLWTAPPWNRRQAESVRFIEAKMEAGKLDGRLADVQALGRMLSTRHTTVQLAGRGRLVVPEGFREFLGVEPGGAIMVVGAAICVELWQTSAWIDYLAQRIPEFDPLFRSLTE